MKKRFIVTAQEGIHARPAALLVSSAASCRSSMELSFNGKSVSLKSILSVMTLSIPVNSTITISADGDDAAEALEKLAEVILSHGIGEVCES